MPGPVCVLTNPHISLMRQVLKILRYACGNETPGDETICSRPHGHLMAQGFPGESDRSGLWPPGALSEHLLYEMRLSQVNYGNTQAWQSGRAS